jgi:hypothetical protein
MKRIVNVVLTMIVLVLGALIVFTNPIDPLAIVIGMFFVSMSILVLAVQIYFPPTSEEPVELRVVEEPVVETKAHMKIEKPTKRAKARKRR